MIGVFCQVIDAADPWCGLTCAWGFFTGTLVVFVTLLIGQKLRRAPRQHKGNDGDQWHWQPPDAYRQPGRTTASVAHFSATARATGHS